MKKQETGYADRLSYLMDIETLVVVSVAEECGIKESKVAQLFSKSETCKNLFAPNSEYYAGGSDNIYNDFVQELKKAGEI